MSTDLESIEAQLPGKRNFDAPPLHLWNPALSGDIDIRIDAQGQWYHEGTVIGREAIVRVFASILRREADGEYYLVTPGEKWRIQVDLLPLMVVQIDCVGEGILAATLNTGRQLDIGPEAPIFLCKAADNIAAVALPHGLAALCTRNTWYQLVELAEPVDGLASVSSHGQWFVLEEA